MKFLAIPFALTVCATAQAGVIYDTYGAGDSFDTNTGYAVDFTQSIATPFSVNQVQDLFSVQLSLRSGESYTVSLTKGDMTAPGATLATWSVVGGGTVVLTPSATTTLLPGSYYIVAESSGVSGAWMFNSENHTGSFSYTSVGDWLIDNSTTGVMRIETFNAVPEPASLLALAGGVSVFVRRRRTA